MARPFKMKGMSFGNSPMKQDKKADAKEVKELATKVAGKWLKGKRRKRPDYIKSDPGLMRYYDAWDAWEDGGKKGSPPNINDYK